MTAANVAIVDPRAPDLIFAAAKDDLDWGIAWCTLREGMHPENIRRLTRKSMDGDGWLSWIRVKNETPARALVPPDERPRMTAFLALSKPSRVTIWARASALTERAGFAGGPRVLRKTFILNELRRFRGRADAIDLVSARARCRRETVIRHYLDLEQWERAYGT
jgi:hypothetical protein